MSKGVASVFGRRACTGGSGRGTRAEYIILGQHDNICMSWQRKRCCHSPNLNQQTHISTQARKEKGIDDNKPDLAVKYIGPL